MAEYIGRTWSYMALVNNNQPGNFFMGSQFKLISSPSVPYPDLFVTDLSWANIHAILKECNKTTIDAYIEGMGVYFCFLYLLGGRGLNLSLCDLALRH